MSDVKLREFVAIPKPKRDIIATVTNEPGICGGRFFTYAYRCSECDGKFPTDVLAYAHECKARPFAMEAAAAVLINPPFTEPEPRQHVSDAVIDRYGMDDEVIRILEGMYKSTNTMLVTVEEWDARGKDVQEAQSIACYDRAKAAEAKLAERDAQIAQRDDRKKQQDLWVQFWYERCLAAEAKLAAAEEFTRQYADRVMAQNAKRAPVAPRADRYSALLTVAEPTHRLGGDKAR